MSLHVTSETPWNGFLVTWPTFENSKTSSALELLTVKHVHIICYMLSFPSMFIRLWCCTCEELESIKKGKKMGCILSMWRIRMNAIWILKMYVFLTHLWDIGMKYSDILVPILHARWRIGTNYSRCEIYEVWNLRFNTAPIIPQISWTFFNIKNDLMIWFKILGSPWWKVRVAGWFPGAGGQCIYVSFGGWVWGDQANFWK